MRTRTTLAGGTLLLALGALSIPAAAAVLDLQASKDNTLYQHLTGGVSNGVGQFMFAGKNALGEIRRGVIKFDIAAALPTGSTINDATLTLVYDNTGIQPNGTRVVSLRRVAADWGEGTSDAGGEEGNGAASTTGDATWIHTFFNTSLWGTAGGAFSGVTSASQTIGLTGGPYAWTGPTLVADVQSMLDAPAGNFGWGVFGDEGVTTTAKRFGTHENPTVSSRPVLTVDYTPGAVVPGLSSWGLLAQSALLAVAAYPFLRRRARVA